MCLRYMYLVLSRYHLPNGAHLRQSQEFVRSSLKWERVGSEQHRSFLGKVDEPSTYTSTTLCIYLYANEKRATPFSAPELLPKAIQEHLLYYSITRAELVLFQFTSSTWDLAAEVDVMWILRGLVMSGGCGEGFSYGLVEYIVMGSMKS